ncbi:hypothetical protein QBC34DRAFT_436237 [Podospora aff. communis PSN243]|uniref:Uncharacterized protein n=1 Tax=Podospora aff. communis PSN243 TaxID=3040156 RepID=A0AAV9GW71_9PEZI|nr:hypothetical protein QBC34DRAFT_436237 [Podospora aff. communis PSN243]
MSSFRSWDVGTGNDFGRIKDYALDTEPSSNEHFGQIFAASAALVDYAFNHILFHLETQVKADYLHPEHGEIRAGHIDSPRLAINDSDPSRREVLFCIPLGSYFRARVGALSTEFRSVEGWILSYRIDVTQLRGSTHGEVIGLVPGDYSAHRLLAAFCTTPQWTWSKPDLDESTCVDAPNGPRATLRQWRLRSEDNRKFADGFLHLLELWSQRQREHGAMGKLGLRFNLPTPSDECIPPTCAASRLRVQTWPYPKDPSRVQKKPRGLLGEWPDSPWRCVVFGEAVVGQNPSPRLEKPLDGSFTLALRGEGWLRNIEGTMVIDRRIFWGQYMLPKLQALNRIIEVRLGLVTHDSDGDTAQLSFLSDDVIPSNGKLRFAIRTHYSIGPGTRDGGQLPEANDEHYGFKLSRRDGLFNSNYKQSCKRGPYWHGTDSVFFLYAGEAETETKVVWKPGTCSFEVKGYSLYRHDTRFHIRAKSGDEWKTSWENAPCHKWEARVGFTFGVELTMTTNGVIVPKLINMSSDAGEKHWKPGSIEPSTKTHYTAEVGSGPEQFVKAVYASWFAAFQSLMPSLSESFQADGRFVLCGNDVLEHGKPVFTDGGDLVCQAEYSEEHRRVYKGITNGVRPRPPKKTSQLSWTCKIGDYDANDRRATLALVGKNDDLDETLGFGYIGLSFPPTRTTDTAFFSGLDWSAGSNGGDAPVDSYDFATEKVSERLTVLFDREPMTLAARIYRDLSVKEQELGASDAFVVPPGGSVTIKFRGEISGPGLYLCKVHEAWVNLEEGTKKTGAADVYYRIAMGTTGGDVLEVNLEEARTLTTEL